MGRWCRPRGGLFQRDIVRNGVLLIDEEVQLQRAYLRRRMKKLNPTLQTIPEGTENEEQLVVTTPGLEVRSSRFKLSDQEKRCKKKRTASSSSSSSPGPMSSMPGYYWVSNKIRKLEYCCVERLARLALVL